MKDNLIQSALKSAHSKFFIIILLCQLILPGLAWGQEANFFNTKKSTGSDIYDRPDKAEEDDGASEDNISEQTDTPAVQDAANPKMNDEEKEPEPVTGPPDPSNDSQEKINEEIKKISDQLQNNRLKTKNIDEQQKKLDREIKTIHQGKANLTNQLAIIQNREAKIILDIETAQTEIERTNLEMKAMGLAILNHQNRIQEEVEKLASVLKIINRQDQASTMEIILLNNSLAEFINQSKYLENLNREIKDSLDSLEQRRKELEAENKKLAVQEQKLGEQKRDLEKKRAEMEAEKDNKSLLIGQLNLSEKEYQAKLAAAKAEQEEAAAEIASLEKLMRAKMAALEGEKLAFNDTGFIWPVPKNVITAYFHDPSYPFRFIFEHPGIDVRAYQSTPIRAVASGYVARAKNGGAKGYSYIMLVHGDGLSSVYGHVSRLDVKEDDYVVQGQVIGLSGGMPGTPGAGSLTTGPHLHLEIRLNGIPVDPLAYLP